MSTFTEVLPERKASKHSAMTWQPDMQRPGCGKLTIHTDRCSCSYNVVRFPSDFAGTAFHMAKLEPGSDRESEAYDVFIGPRERHCDCKGWSYKGTCKHVDAADAIVANGWDQLHLTNADADVSSTEAAPF